MQSAALRAAFAVAVSITAAATSYAQQTPTVLVSGVGTSDRVLVDDNGVYWSDYLTGQIRSVGKQGGAVTVYSSVMRDGSDLVQDGTSLYFIGAVEQNFTRSLIRMSKAGGGATVLGSVDSMSSLAMRSGGGVLFYEGVDRDVDCVVATGKPAQVFPTRIIASRAAAGGSEAALIYDRTFVPSNCISGSLPYASWLTFDHPTTDQTYVYWAGGTGGNEIWRMPLGGGSAAPFISNRRAPSAIVAPTTGAAAGSIFWTEFDAAFNLMRVMRYSTSGQITMLIDGVDSDFAVDGDKVYCEQAGRLMQVSIDGGTPTVLVEASLAHRPWSIAVDANFIYWSTATGGEIMKVSRPGGGMPPPPPTPGCSFTVNPLAASYGPLGGSGFVSVTPSPLTCTWTATSGSSFISIIDPGPGSGHGSVLYTVSVFASGSRTGTLTVAGQAVTITQAPTSTPPPSSPTPCTDSLSSLGQNFSGAGGTGSFVFTASPATQECPWSAVTNPAAAPAPPAPSGAWITLTSPATGVNTATVSYEVAPNLTTAPRNGSISIGTRTFTVTQEAGSLRRLDPNHIRLVDSFTGRLTANVTRVAARIPELPSRVGTSTDGVSRLLIAIKSIHALTLSVTLELDGSVQSIAGLSQPTIEPQQIPGEPDPVVLAWYTPPQRLVTPAAGTESRTIRIHVSDPSVTNASGEIPVTLERPPVVLVHGQWDSPLFWTGDGFAESLRLRGYRYTLANYEPFNSRNWDPGTTIAVPAVQRVQADIIRALNEQRSRSIAASQVDVVAHSMGGLVTRALMQQGDCTEFNRDSCYRDFSNYERGWIRRLITIGTPHEGTPVARVMFEKRDFIIPFGLSGFVKVKDLLRLTGRPIEDGSVEAMIPGSAAYRHLRDTCSGPSPVPAYAITGDRLPAAMVAPDVANVLIAALTGSTLDALIGEDHDMLVGVTSQGGRHRAPDTLARFASTVHSPSYLVPVLNTNVNSEADHPGIHSRVADLLDSDGAEFECLPAPWVPPAQTTEITASKIVAPAADGRAIRLTSPSPGATILQAAGTTLTLTAEAIGGAAPQSVTFAVGNSLTVQAPSAAPYTVSVALPARVPLGPLNIVALAVDADGSLLSDSREVVIMPPGAATGISADPASLTFAPGQRVAQPVRVVGTFDRGGGAAAAWDVSSSALGTTYVASKGSAVVTVTADGLVTPVASGTDTIEIRHGSQTLSLPVVVEAAGSSMTADKSTLTFAATTSAVALIAKTADQVVRLTKSGTAQTTWTATSNKPWLTVTPASGSGPAALSIGVKFDPTLPASGAATGAITFIVNGASAPNPIDVNLSIVPPASVAAPIGVLDTPAGDATVLAGSIAVTGWALDNIGVKRVEIWRDLQPGETTPPFTSTPADPRAGKVFIANALFIDGARPDVETLYPAMPVASRAGWGYLLLTAGLWNQGNGTYTLHAFAFDEENSVSKIGEKTIVVNNSAATKPFGSIDTPAIGGDAGTAPNFGWALTPKVNGAATCKIQPSGVQVSIDSGPLQPVAYGDARSDIAGAFPGFSNSAAAGGHFVFDWSTLAPGPHTIGWFVTDDCNRADGIGSRFFNVTGGSALRAAPVSARARAQRAIALDTESAEEATVTYGFGGELPRIVKPAADGWGIVRLEQGGRIELRLPRRYESAEQIVNGQARSLPSGSTWDPASATFYWQPAPAFLGTYHLVFSNSRERISVRVIVEPKGP